MARRPSRVGALRQRVTFQTRVDTESGDYSAQSTYANIAAVPTVWAKVVNVSGTQQIDSKNAGEGVSHRITIRYRADISIKNVALYTSPAGTYRYSIATIQSAEDERNRFLILECNQLEKVGEFLNPSPENP